VAVGVRGALYDYEVSRSGSVALEHNPPRVCVELGTQAGTQPSIPNHETNGRGGVRLLTAGDWLADLDVPVLAGSAGADRCVNDLYFLSHHITQVRDSARNSIWCQANFCIRALISKRYNIVCYVRILFAYRLQSV